MKVSKVNRSQIKDHSLLEHADRLKINTAYWQYLDGSKVVAEAVSAVDTFEKPKNNMLGLVSFNNIHYFGRISLIGEMEQFFEEAIANQRNSNLQNKK